jgi:hypothetical protein
MLFEFIAIMYNFGICFHELVDDICFGFLDEDDDEILDANYA